MTKDKVTFNRGGISAEISGGVLTIKPQAKGEEAAVLPFRDYQQFLQWMQEHEDLMKPG